MKWYEGEEIYDIYYDILEEAMWKYNCEEMMTRSSDEYMIW